MKATKKRPRSAKPRKPIAKRAPAKAAAPKRRPAAKPTPKAAERRLVIRFNDPGDVDWLGAQGERMGFGSAKGSGASTYAKMLIRAARECGGDPINALRRTPPAPIVRESYRGIVQEFPAHGGGNDPIAQDAAQYPATHDEPESELVDVDALVDQVAGQVENQGGLDMRRAEREAYDDAQERSGGVRVVGERMMRRPSDWRR